MRWPPPSIAAYVPRTRRGAALGGPGRHRDRAHVRRGQGHIARRVPHGEEVGPVATGEVHRPDGVEMACDQRKRVGVHPGQRLDRQSEARPDLIRLDLAGDHVENREARQAARVRRRASGRGCDPVGDVEAVRRQLDVRRVRCLPRQVEEPIGLANPPRPRRARSGPIPKGSGRATARSARRGAPAPGSWRPTGSGCTAAPGSPSFRCRSRAALPGQAAPCARCRYRPPPSRPPGSRSRRLRRRLGVGGDDARLATSVPP